MSYPVATRPARQKRYAALLLIHGQLPTPAPTYIAQSDREAIQRARIQWDGLCRIRRIERLDPSPLERTEVPPA